jgi:hypothetical protein
MLASIAELNFLSHFLHPIAPIAHWLFVPQIQRAMPTHKAKRRFTEFIPILDPETTSIQPHAMEIPTATNLPVTIKYPEIVAEIAPHFDGVKIPAFGNDNL